MKYKGFVLFLFLALFCFSFSDWPTDPRENLPVCTSPGDQKYPQIVKDGHGGAIIVWSDSRGANEDIYAQDVSSSGDIQWAYNGVPVCVNPGRQYNFDVASYAGGGAIVAWINQDDEHVYAQFLSRFGNLNWRPSGIRTEWADTKPSVMETDELDNIMIAFIDYRGGNRILFVYKLESDDSIAWHKDKYLGWNGTYSFKMVEAGGRDGVVLFSKSIDVHAVKVSEHGVWLWGGRPININYRIHGDQINVDGIYNGHGKILVVWQDGRSGNWDIYGAWVASDDGSVYPPNGMPICTAPDSQITPKIISDGSRGAIVVWMDRRSGNWDIYAQRITPTPSGLDTLWALNGITITNKPQDEKQFNVISDNSGGAIIVWKDIFEGNIYAQRISGGVRLWRAGGVPITLSEHASFPSIVEDDSCGAIIAWQDTRDGDADIYAQRVRYDGSLGGTSRGGKLVYAGPASINGDESVVIDELDRKISPGDHIHLRLPITNIGSETISSSRIILFKGESPYFSPKVYFSRGPAGPYRETLSFPISSSISPGSTVYVDLWVYVSCPEYENYSLPLPPDPIVCIGLQTKVYSLNLHLSPVHFDVSAYHELKSEDCLRHPNNFLIKKYAQYAVANDSINNIHKDPDVDSIAVLNLMESIAHDFKVGAGGSRISDTELLLKYSMPIGVCRHFTDLSCGLLRSLGFPTRDVFSIFLIKKRIPFSLRWRWEMNAHTWNEVYMPTKSRWIQFDAANKLIDNNCAYSRRFHYRYYPPVVASKVALASSYSGNLSGTDPNRLLYCPCCFGLSNCSRCMLVSVASMDELFSRYSCAIDTYFRYSENVSRAYIDSCTFRRFYTISADYLMDDSVFIKLRTPNYVERGSRFNAFVYIINRSSRAYNNLYVVMPTHYDAGDTIDYFFVSPDTGFFVPRLNAHDSLTFVFSITPLVIVHNTIISANVYDTIFSVFSSTHKFITIGSPGGSPMLICRGLAEKNKYYPGDTINLQAVVRDTINVIDDAIVNAYIMSLVDSIVYDTVPMTAIDSIYNATYVLPDTCAIGEYSIHFIASKTGYSDGDYYSYFQVLPLLNVTAHINSPRDGVSFHSNEWVIISAVVNCGGKFIDSAFVTSLIAYNNDTVFMPLDYSIPDSMYLLHFKPKDFIGTFGASCTSSAVWNINVIARYSGSSDTTTIMELPVSVQEIEKTNIPTKLTIGECYPNPFNSTITIKYGLPSGSNVRIEILNIVGKLICVLYNGYNSEGYHELVWHADKNPSGIYFIRINTCESITTKKIILIK